MDLARDFQRSKVYAWQREILKEEVEHDLYAGAVTAMVCHICADFKIPQPKIYHHTDHNFAGIDNVLEFCYPNQFTVIHEMAHLHVFNIRRKLDYEAALKISAHGPEFVGTYAKMLAIYVRTLHEPQLLACASAMGVKWEPLIPIERTHEAIPFF